MLTQYLLRLLKSLFLLGSVLIVSSCSHKQDKQNSINQPLYYKFQGTGQPALIMLHGMLDSHHYWDGVVSQMGMNHELILIDLLGFGESPKPEIEYSVAQHIAKIEEVTKQAHLEKSRAVIV